MNILAKGVSVILDWYFKIPMLVDVLICGLSYLSIHFAIASLHVNVTFDQGTLLNVISNVIGTCVSLAGFILAALTIIVTFKSNLKAKGIEEAENALELIFSSKHYSKIVKLYKDAMIELTVTFIALYFVWLFSGSLSSKFLLIATFSGVAVTSLTIIRSLLLLFKILGMEKFNQDNEGE